MDYEDIQEEYDGPEVQLAPQEMQFYAQAALAGPPKKMTMMKKRTLIQLSSTSSQSLSHLSRLSPV